MQAADAVDLDTGMTAFHIACDANQPECAEELTRAGCDVGAKGNNGETGREIAERRGHAAVVARLRAAAGEQLPAPQAAVRLPAASGGVVGDGGPADQLVTAAGEGDREAVARLLAAGGDPNALVSGQLPSGEVLQTTALHGLVPPGAVKRP